MPYGPGAFEGEPYSTFVLNEWSMVSSEDDSCSNEAGDWAALFVGPFERHEVTIEHIVHGYDAGYTEVEMADGVEWLLDAQAAILETSSQGFYSATLYNDVEAARNDYHQREVEWAPDDEPE